MILTERIVPEEPGVTFGAALRKYIYNKGPETAQIRHKYVANIIDSDYDQLPDKLVKIFMTMKNEGIGLDYQIFYVHMNMWDDPDREARGNVASVIYKAGHGGYREGAGRKPAGDQPKVSFPVSRVAADVAQIVRNADNMTEFVERAIRAYDKLGRKE